MICVQNFLRGRYVHPIAGQLCPRDFQTGVQVGSENGCLGGTEGGFIQAGYFLEQLLAHFGGRIGTLDFGVVFLYLITGIAVQLRLNDLHLLPQIIISLVFVNLFADFLVDFGFQLQNFRFLVQKDGYLFQPFQRVEDLQDGLLVFGAHQHVGGDQIGQKTGIFHRTGSQEDLIGCTGDILHHGFQGGQRLPHQSLGLYVAAGGFVQRDGFRHQLRIHMAVCHIIRQGGCTAYALSDHAYVTVGGLQSLTDLADRTNGVQILCLRGFDADVFLSNEKYMSTGLRCEIAGRDGNFTG